MSNDSLSIYFRSLIVEAMGLGARDIRIAREGEKTKIAMRVEGEFIDYPHPPRKPFGDLIAFLKNRAGAPGNGAEHTAELTVTRRGEVIPLHLRFAGADAAETVEIHIAAG